MNFNALDEEPEILAPGPVEALRRVFGQSVQLVIGGANESCIPLQLRGASRNKSLGGPVDHVLAVKLAADSDNLAAVGCNSPEHLAAFQQANPILQASLVTCWKDWTLVWLRTAPRPDNFVSEPWMWLAQGTIPLSWMDEDAEAVQIVHEGAPIEIPFSEVQWPEIVFESFRVARLKQSHGPIFNQRKKSKTLNDFFWANWLAERLGLIYNSKLSAFRRFSENGTEVQTLTADAMIQLVHQALQQAASATAGSFPIQELRLPRIKQLIELMRIATAVEPHNVAEALESYVATLRQDKAATITTEELWLDYARFCREHRLQTYPRFEFLKTAPSRIREIFGVAKAHDIQRDDKPRRGFRGIATATKNSSSNHGNATEKSPA